MQEDKKYPIIVQKAVLQHIRGGIFMGKNEESSKGIVMGDALVLFGDNLDELEKMYSSLNSTPKEILERILEEIIGQDEAVEKLTIAVYYNQMLNLIEELDGDNKYDRLTIFLIGNTGVGKTATVKALSKYFNVPFVRYSVDSITSAGYVGNKVEDILINLFNKANRDLALAERGIIFLDEFDKKVKQESSAGRDINGEAVQQELLKFLEPSLVELSLSDKTRVPFETGRLTVILGGACVGLDKVRDKRLHRVPKVGFTHEEQSSQEDNEYISEDLINYGLIPELVGRITIIDTFRDLDDNDIYNILK